MWAASGLVFSLALALVAWLRSRASSRGYYEGEVYGMGAAAHRKYALGFALNAVVFLVLLVLPISPDGPGNWVLPAAWALLVLVGILYGAGFLRGASGEDE